MPKHVSRKDCKIIGEGKKEESEGVAKEKEEPIASIGANMNRGRFPVKIAWFLYLSLSDGTKKLGTTKKKEAEEPGDVSAEAECGGAAAGDTGECVVAPGLRRHEHDIRREPAARDERTRLAHSLLAVRSADSGAPGPGPADGPQQALCVSHVRGLGEHSAGGRQLRQLERHAGAPAPCEPRLLQGQEPRRPGQAGRGEPLGAGREGGASRQGLCVNASIHSVIQTVHHG